MDFFDAKNNIVRTEMNLRDMGANQHDPQVLESFDLHPMRYEYPEYNPDTHEIVPDGGAVPDEANEGGYVQRFLVNELSAEQQAGNLTRKAQAKADEARSMADEATKPLLADFSATEKLTFPQQEAEVLAYLADNSAPTPVLDSLAESRGISREEQITKAVTKVTLFRSLSAYIVGKQQGYEDQVKAISTDEAKTAAQRMAELDGLVFDYTLPSSDPA